MRYINPRWANIEMIKFWAPTPLGRGRSSGAKFLFDDPGALGDIAPEPPNVV